MSILVTIPQHVKCEWLDLYYGVNDRKIAFKKNLEDAIKIHGVTEVKNKFEDYSNRFLSGVKSGKVFNFFTNGFTIFSYKKSEVYLQKNIFINDFKKIKEEVYKSLFINNLTVESESLKDFNDWHIYNFISSNSESDNLKNLTAEKENIDVELTNKVKDIDPLTINKSWKRLKKDNPEYKLWFDHIVSICQDHCSLLYHNIEGLDNLPKEIHAQVIIKFLGADTYNLIYTPEKKELLSLTFTRRLVPKSFQNFYRGTLNTNLTKEEVKDWLIKLKIPN